MVEPPKGLAPSAGLTLAVDAASQPREIAQLGVVVHADTLVFTPGGASGAAVKGPRLTTAQRPARSAPSPGYSRVGTAGAQGAGTAAGARGTSAAKAKTSSSETKSSGPLAFLDDPKLSVEEKLFKFMSYVADRYDKAIEKKMDDIAGKQSTTSASTAKKKSGLLGKIASGVSGVVGGLTGTGGGTGGILGAVLPAAGLALDLLQDTGIQKVVTQLSGPVLAAGATALGFPALAPALLEAGPGIARGAFEVVDALAGDGAGTSTGSSAKAAPSSTRTAGDPQVEQKDLLELQHLQNKQQEMFGLVSNMLRSMHDTKMAAINNMRV